MGTVYFSSLADGDVVNVEFATRDGGFHSSRLFVDSGFTGDSSLILSEELSPLALGNVSAAHTSGALQGRQRRVLVNARVPGMRFQCNLLAIITDVASLSLPSGVEGMVGLSFLRQFAVWGSERTDEVDWRFFLSDGGVGP